MQSKIWYSESERLEKLIITKNAIPHKLIPGEKLIRNHYYYDSIWNKIYRVISVEYKEGEFEGAYIKNDDNTYAWIVDLPNPLYDYYITFDKLGIWKEEIINTNKAYTGAEIRYWFFRNNIDIFNEKYLGFWKYVEQSGDDAIEDKAFYLLYGDIDDNGNYIECRVVHANSKHFENLTDKEIEYNKKYWSDLKKRDQQRLKERKKKYQE